jgi:tRNA1(Val) A37 N6-methylase TrmN6
LHGLQAVAGDVTIPPVSGRFDHAFANPPYHLGLGSQSPSRGRDQAKRRPEGLFGAWVAGLARNLRYRGTLTLILPAAHLPVAIAGMTGAGCAPAIVVPLWPQMGCQAKLVILRGVHGGKMGLSLHWGLVLHDAIGRLSAAAEAVLRDGQALPILGCQLSRRLTTS